MDFIDNAVVKAKEVIDVACKKTNQIVNTQKQKIDVTGLENKLNKDYQRLGAIYFEEIKDSEIENCEIRELVDAIKAKKEKINKLKEEIIAAKKKRICASCGAAIDKNSVFCNLCGVKLEFDSED